MMVVVFRSRLRADADLAAIGRFGQRMAELAAAMPGFIDYKDYAAEDGEYLTLARFDSEAHLQAWAAHPEHRAVQEEGRRSFFSEYSIEICTPWRAYAFSVASGRHETKIE